MALITMAEGIRTTVEFASSSPCGIATASRETDSRIDSVWQSVPSDGGSGPLTEFLVETDRQPSLPDIDHVISVGGRHVFRLDHDGSPTCPCECLGLYGCSVQRYVSQSGAIRLVFNAADFEELQSVMDELRDRFPDLDVRRLVRSPDSEPNADPVFVDRKKLTGRQLQVLQTAYRMGYFARPRGANATEVAEELDIDSSTLGEHLASAQRKIIGDILEGER